MGVHVRPRGSTGAVNGPATRSELLAMRRAVGRAHRRAERRVCWLSTGGLFHATETRLPREMWTEVVIGAWGPLAHVCA